jgi:hypothetical protein
MLRSMPNQAYLADLQARNRRNREVVETTILPLSEAERSWSPKPGEWSVDQCIQHLILAFEMYVHNTTSALSKPEPAHADGIFRPSWWARRTLEWQFNPETKISTLKRVNPEATYSPDVLARWLAQQYRLSAMIEQAVQADLQTKCWFFKGLPIRYNLGDYLNFFVSHDELHIDQAQRVLAAYRHWSENEMSKTAVLES